MAPCAWLTLLPGLGQRLESHPPPGSCGWLLFTSRYLILFRNELMRCFKNILWHCEAIISVLNGIKARIADAFTKVKENIYLLFKNNQKKQSTPGWSSRRRSAGAPHG